MPGYIPCAIFLTEAGEHTDPFTLQYVTGHDNIKTTMRYVHPRAEAVEKLFVRLGDLERPENIQSSETLISETLVKESVQPAARMRKAGAESGAVVRALRAGYI
jgi:hypothetical protein